MTAEGLRREACQQRRQGAWHGEATRGPSAPALTELGISKIDSKPLV